MDAAASAASALNGWRTWSTGSSGTGSSGSSGSTGSGRSSNAGRSGTMTYELRLERLYDAAPEVVFDAFVDPATQEELHGSADPNWTVERAETDVRVGGTSTYVMGLRGEDPDTETRVFTVVDR